MDIVGLDSRTTERALQTKKSTFKLKEYPFRPKDISDQYMVYEGQRPFQIDKGPFS